MDILDDIFTFDVMTRMRRDRIREIRTALGRSLPAPTSIADRDDPVGYAVSHHLLEGAEPAARAKDEQTFAWYRHGGDGALRNLSEAAGSRMPIVLAPEIAAMPQSSISQTPYFLIGPGVTQADMHLRHLVGDAVGHTSRLGFAELVAGHAPIVCLLRRKDLGGTLDSWTITRLPGTVFVDYTASAAVLGRDLVHEAGHNWLNDALASCRVKIPDNVDFYSPWKQTNRPAFGFLHACWAFPLTMIYAARVLPDLDGDERTYVSNYLAKQQRYLADTPLDHQAALTLIDNEELRSRLHTVYAAAIDL